jgi:integrase
VIGLRLRIKNGGEVTPHDPATPQAGRHRCCSAARRAPPSTTPEMPIAGVSRPTVGPAGAEVDQRFLSEDQVALLVKHFREHGQRRDALILTIFYACALRPGELFALRWNDWDLAHPDLLRIDEAFGKSGLDTPKAARSRSHVYLPPAVQQELRVWQEWCGDVKPGAWIFTSKRGTPLSYDNYLERTLRPAAEACGIAGITHQMLRRAFSTAAVDAGASPKDVQAQMRHTQANMSLYYAKAIPKSVAEEVNKLTDRLLSKAAPADKEQPAEAANVKAIR